MRPREVSFILEKEEEGPYWDRLLTTKLKQPWLRSDSPMSFTDFISSFNQSLLIRVRIDLIGIKSKIIQY